MKARTGQLHEGMMLSHGDGFGIGRDVTNKSTRVLAGESERCFHLCVLREILGAWQIEGRPREIGAEGSVVSPLQNGWDMVGVAQIELRRVH
jgi:hypothetical protein